MNCENGMVIKSYSTYVLLLNNSYLFNIKIEITQSVSLLYLISRHENTIPSFRGCQRQELDS